MKQTKLLKGLLIVAILLDALTLLAWISTSALAGAGIPGLVLTIVLLIAHIRTIKHIRNNLPIPQKNTRTQIIAGLLLILLVGCIISFLSVAAVQTRPPMTQVALSVAAIVIPSLTLYIGVIISIKKYNNSLSLDTSSNLQ